MKPETTLDRARTAYEQIMRIHTSLSSHSTFPPSLEDEAKEHDRVYWERVAVIERLLHD